MIHRLQTQLLLQLETQRQTNDCEHRNMRNIVNDSFMSFMYTIYSTVSLFFLNFVLSVMRHSS